MKTMIMSTGNLNEVLNSETKLDPEQWDMLMEKLRTLENNNLRELAQLTNSSIKLLAKMVLNERGAIKL